MTFQRRVPIPAHRLNRSSRNAAMSHSDNATPEQQHISPQNNSAAVVPVSGWSNKLNLLVAFVTLVVAILSSWGGYEFNKWQQSNTTKLAASQDAQDKLTYDAVLNMACVQQAHLAVTELQIRPQSVSQIFDSLKTNEAKCQAVGVPLTARAAWLVTTYPERIDRKIVVRAARTLDLLTTRPTSSASPNSGEMMTLADTLTAESNLQLQNDGVTKKRDNNSFEAAYGTRYNLSEEQVKLYKQMLQGRKDFIDAFEAVKG